jgi:hypothetical protein
VQNPIQEDEKAELAAKVSHEKERYYSIGHKREDETAEQKKQLQKVWDSIKLTNEEQRVIRDKHFSCSVMCSLWNMMKQRHFQFKQNEGGSAFAKMLKKSTDKEETLVTKTMKKDEHMQMLRSMFKMMVNGFSQERLLVLMDEALKNSGQSNQRPENQENEIFETYEGQVYMSLATEKYDPGEYRLPLWMPLTLEQKLDMMLH